MTKDELEDVLDPLSATFVHTRSSNPICDDTLPVFDGRVSISSSPRSEPTARRKRQAASPALRGAVCANRVDPTIPPSSSYRRPTRSRFGLFLYLGLAGLLVGLALTEKVQALLPALTIPMIALTFGTDETNVSVPTVSRAEWLRAIALLRSVLPSYFPRLDFSSRASAACPRAIYSQRARARARLLSPRFQYSVLPKFKYAS